MAETLEAIVDLPHMYGVRGGGCIVDTSGGLWKTERANNMAEREGERGGKEKEGEGGEGGGGGGEREGGIGGGEKEEGKETHQPFSSVYIHVMASSDRIKRLIGQRKEKHHSHLDTNQTAQRANLYTQHVGAVCIKTTSLSVVHSVSVCVVLTWGS